MPPPANPHPIPQSHVRKLIRQGKCVRVTIPPSVARAAGWKIHDDLHLLLLPDGSLSVRRIEWPPEPPRLASS